MISAPGAASYILSLQDKESGDLTNLKLQKLLYYAQGFHLAILARPLFWENLEAWEHGPVVPSVWKIYREYGSKPLPIPEKTKIVVLPVESRDVVDEVYEVFGKFSAWKLRNMTHLEPPWLSHSASRSIIPTSSLLKYFSTQVFSG